MYCNACLHHCVRRLEELRLSKEWTSNEQFTIGTTMRWKGRGGKWVVSARCLNKNEVRRE
jgi:hypothetical protein